MKQITLEVVVERLDNLIKDNTEDHKIIIDWLRKNNGATAENTKWRHYIMAGLFITDIMVIPIFLAITINYISKVL